MDISHRSVIVAETQRLIEVGLYDSAEKLAAFFISSLENLDYRQFQGNDSLYNVYFEFYELLGDSLYKKNEIKRALGCYRNASLQRRNNQNQGFKFKGQSAVNSTEDARIRFKECRCMSDLKDYSGALRELETVPKKRRTAEIHVLLARLNRRMSLSRQAIASYKEALLLMPTSIEIIEDLISLGVDGSEIMSVVDEAVRTTDKAYLQGCLTASGWLATLVQGLVAKRNYENQKSLESFQQLSVKFPKNAYLLLHTGQAAFEAELSEIGLSCCRQVCSVKITHIVHLVLRNRLTEYFKRHQ